MRIIPLSLQRKFWRLVSVARNPSSTWRDFRKWRNRPRLGEAFEGCDGRMHTVKSFGETEDDLIAEDGASYSWMNCCDRPVHLATIYQTKTHRGTACGYKVPKREVRRLITYVTCRSCLVLFRR